MSVDLPLLIDPLRFARNGESIKGSFQLEQLVRLKSLLYDSKGEVKFELQFTQEVESRFFIISGNFEVLLKMTCQRCLQQMDLKIMNRINLGIVSSDNEIDDLPVNIEPLVYSEGKISLLELIEDEILLAVPVAPLHMESDCSASKIISVLGDKSKYSPFEQLKDLKQNIEK